MVLRDSNLPEGDGEIGKSQGSRKTARQLFELKSVKAYLQVKKLITGFNRL